MAYVSGATHAVGYVPLVIISVISVLLLGTAVVWSNRRRAAPASGTTVAGAPATEGRSAAGGSVTSLPVVANAVGGDGKLTINTARLYVFGDAWVLRPAQLVGRYDSGRAEVREAQLEKQIMGQIEGKSAEALIDALKRLNEGAEQRVTGFQRFAGAWRFAPPPPLLIRGGAVKANVVMRSGGPGLLATLTMPTTQLQTYRQIEGLPHVRAQFENVAGLRWIDFAPDQTVASVTELLAQLNATPP